MLWFLVGFIAAFLGYLIWSRRKAFAWRDELQIKGPPTHPFFGNVLHIYFFMKQRNEGMLRLFIKWQEEYGRVYGFFVGPTLNVIISDLEMLKEIFVAKFECFSGRMKFALYDTPPVDEMLICMKGQEGREMRRLVSPIFSISKLKSMQYIMEEKLQIFTELMDQRADSGSNFDITKSISTLILEMTGEYCFGIESDCQRNHKDKFLNDCVNVFDNFDFEESIILQLAVLFPEFDHYLSKLRNCTGFGKAEDSLMNVLRYVYEKRKQGQTVDTKNCVDMLRILYELSEKQKNDQLKTFSNRCPKISDNNIISNALFFLEAGYETTSTALGFASWLLAKHPNVQKEIQSEIEDACKGMRLLDYNVIRKLPMLDAVFHESLRMYPPVVYFATRTCTKACTIADQKFEPGVVVVLPTYNIHHDPEYWPNPDIFDPYRFYKKHDHHPMSWVPFGAGPRNCIGLRFAEMEYKMTLATLLKNFNLELGPESESELKVRQKGAFVQPCNGIIVKVTHRKNTPDE